MWRFCSFCSKILLVETHVGALIGTDICGGLDIEGSLHGYGLMGIRSFDKFKMMNQKLGVGIIVVKLRPSPVSSTGNAVTQTLGGQSRLTCRPSSHLVQINPLKFGRIQI